MILTEVLDQFLLGSMNVVLRRPVESAEGRPITLRMTMTSRRPRLDSCMMTRCSLTYAVLALGLIWAIVGFTFSELLNRHEAVASAQSAEAATHASLPPGLHNALNEMASREPGRNGVMVRSVADGTSAGFRGGSLFALGSLRRVWLGAALLDAVDHGDLDLDQQVPLFADKRVNETDTASVRSLLLRSVADNDQIAQDHVLEGLNGPQGLQRWLSDQAFNEITFGGPWSQRPKPDDSYDGLATPDGIAGAMARLVNGNVLQPNSTAMLLDMAAERKIEVPGWSARVFYGDVWRHNAIIGANAIAIVNSRNGDRFTVAVFAQAGPGVVQRRERLLAAALQVMAWLEKLHATGLRHPG